MTMPGRDGFDVLQQLRRECPGAPDPRPERTSEDQLAFRLLKAQAAGYLTKQDASRVVVAAIRQILRGERYISESLAQRLAVDLISAIERSRHESLSDREYQISACSPRGREWSKSAKNFF
jgi:two-component system, NarL family, invasion response regulator UvrY